MLTKYSITGITCDHCVAHIKDEVSRVSGVEAVEVDRSGSMVISSQASIEFSLLLEAVSEAGDYTLAPLDSSSDC